MFYQRQLAVAGAFWRCCRTPISTEGTSMEVILLQKGLDQHGIGERVKVRSGYGLGFLLPRARRRRLHKNMRASRPAAPSSSAWRASNWLSAEEAGRGHQDFKLTDQARRAPRAVGSIGTGDIAEACTRRGFDIERSEVRLPGPLHAGRPDQLHHAGVGDALP